MIDNPGGRCCTVAPHGDVQKLWFSLLRHVDAFYSVLVDLSALNGTLQVITSWRPG